MFEMLKSDIFTHFLCWQNFPSAWSEAAQTHVTCDTRGLSHIIPNFAQPKSRTSKKPPDRHETLVCSRFRGVHNRCGRPHALHWPARVPRCAAGTLQAPSAPDPRPIHAPIGGRK